MGLLFLINPFLSVPFSGTVGAGQGAYVLTGQDVALIRQALLTAAQGSYAVTGQAAALNRLFTLAAEQGSYALSGHAAAFLRDLALTAGQGAYALSGQSAGLLRALSMAAGQGSYSLSGQDAAFATGIRLTADYGSYTLTGQDISFVRALLMVAAQGSYTLAGQGVGLVRALAMAAGQGSYALSGQDAALNRALGLAAAQGSYALTGQAAALNRARSMVAAQGSYSLSGQAATLTYAGGATMPTFVDVKAALNNGKSNTAPGAFASSNAGDIFVAITTGASTPSGYTSRATVVVNSITWRVSTKVRTVGNEAHGVTSAFSPAIVYLMRDVDATTPVDDIQGSYRGSSDTTIDFAGATASNANSMALLSAAFWGTRSVDSASFSSLTSVTERLDTGGSGTGATTFIAAYTGEKAAAGSIAAGTMTLRSVLGIGKYGIIVVLNGA